MKLLVVVVIMFVLGAEAAKEKAIKVKDKDMMRKMIIYDKKSPNVFYCPVPNKQLKSYSMDKMIVKWVENNLKSLIKTFMQVCVFRSHPLSKLCEYEGAGKPKDAKTDCFNDVDETEFACKEKYRIMVSW